MAQEMQHVYPLDAYSTDTMPCLKHKIVERALGAVLASKVRQTQPSRATCWFVDLCLDVSEHTEQWLVNLTQGAQMQRNAARKPVGNWLDELLESGMLVLYLRATFAMGRHSVADNLLDLARKSLNSSTLPMSICFGRKRVRPVC